MTTTDAAAWPVGPLHLSVLADLGEPDPQPFHVGLKRIGSVDAEVDVSWRLPAIEKRRDVLPIQFGPPRDPSATRLETFPVHSLVAT